MKIEYRFNDKWTKKWTNKEISLFEVINDFRERIELQFDLYMNYGEFYRGKASSPREIWFPDY